MSPIRVLVVADGSAANAHISGQLRAAGHEVVAVAQPGAAAVAQSLALQPDIILLDMEFAGGMGGLETAKEMQKQQDVPVVYMATAAEEAALLQDESINPLGILRKPFIPRELETIIQMALCHWRTEKKLRASEARYQMLFEHSPDAIFVLVDGRVKLVNPSGAAMLGARSTAELVGCQLSSMVASAGCLAKEHEAPVETTFRRLDGDPITVECTAVPCFFEDQDALHIVARDISARKQAEAHAQARRELAEALHQSAVHLVNSLEETMILRGVLGVIERVLPHDGSAILLFDHGHNLRRTQVSGVISDQPAILAILQKEWPTIKEVYQDEIAALKTPFMVSQVSGNPQWANLLELGWVQSIVAAPILSPERLLGFIVLVSAKPNSYDGGSAAPLQAFAAQVAIALENAQLYCQVQQHAAELERRVAARTVELEQERGRLQIVLDAVGEGIYLTDKGGNLLYVNPTLEQMTGYSWPELVGKKPHQTWRSRKTPEHVILDLTHAFAQGRPWSGEVVNQRKDGTFYDAGLTINPVHDQDNELAGYVCVQRDITHKKELARLKDAFVSQIGHELRTPITNIRLYHDLLSRRPDKTGHYVTVLRQETDRLANLVEGFIEISLLNADALPVKHVFVDMAEIMDSLIFDFAQTAQERKIELEVRKQQGIPRVMADIYLLNRALRELLENALHYTPPGGKVTVETAVLAEQNQQWVTCTIRDTGPGIAPAEQPFLFERFFRGKVTQEFNVPGAGLGLPICHEIIKKLGGHITLQSESGQGASFMVWLPPAEEVPRG